ncbi:hypothetical protein C0Q70_20479 [Pomacea canaliculata]|uniref:Small ribosomal subunit protein bS16m n=2 Tax=Pomacea canaliculata TaxID=400727 RepID=A0A2T7NFQ2_POMCA|nr:hypothetical protein C0Q70_20479 [Pomacea canaliculata]
MENHASRDIKPLEQLGSYDPLPNIHQEKLVAINFDRLRYWIASGAQCSKPVEHLLGLAGFFPLHPMSIINARRNREKAKKQEQEAAEAAAEKTAVKTES